MELLREHSVPAAAETISRQRPYPCWLVMRNRLWWHPGNWRDANLVVDLRLVHSSCWRGGGGKRNCQWLRRGEMLELDVDSCRVSSLLHLDVCWYFFFSLLMFVKVPAVPAVISFAAPLCRVREGIVEDMQMESSIWFLVEFIFLLVGNFWFPFFFLYSPHTSGPTMINIYVLGHIKV